MRKLSSGQLKAASEITGNITVAWFSAGAISPVFVRPQDIFGFLSSFLLSMIMAGVFSAFSLSLTKGMNLPELTLMVSSFSSLLLGLTVSETASSLGLRHREY
ncbi:MAG: hypothetical protein M1120_01485 [Patescibacteria group bacterium]|nr:hypothetical protein [Patescibacteria group bacterium]